MFELVVPDGYLKYLFNLKVNSLMKSREQVQQTCRLDALHPEVDCNIFMPKEQNVMVNICVRLDCLLTLKEIDGWTGMWPVALRKKRQLTL